MEVFGNRDVIGLELGSLSIASSGELDISNVRNLFYRSKPN